MTINEDSTFLMDDRSLLLDEAHAPKLTPQQQDEIDAKCKSVIEEYLRTSEKATSPSSCSSRRMTTTVSR